MEFADGTVWNAAALYGGTGDDILTDKSHGNSGWRPAAEQPGEPVIQSMATFSSETGLTWEQAFQERPDDAQAILAAHWNPAA